MLLLFPSITQAQRRTGPKGQYDLWLLLAAVGLASLGVVMVASSSIAVAAGKHIGEFHYLIRHGCYLALGIGLALAAMRIELRFVEKNRFVWLALGLFLMLAVFLPGVGVRINGARRWLDLGPIGFQPVEAMKLVLVVYLASYLTNHREAVTKKFLGTFNPLAVALLVAGLSLLQPDFGSAALLLAVTVGMVWLGGSRMSDLLSLCMVLLPAGGFILISQDYRVQRLMSFLNPWKDPFDNGFQLVQALIAIGRGEWFGVGLGGSVQKLFYLPEAHTDFILAVIGEELGLAGIVLVLGLYGLLVWRGLAIGLRGLRANKPFAAHVAFGISLMIGLQALVSVGVNLGVLPTKGLTLPLISSGGSSVVMTCVMLGVLLRAGWEITRAEATRGMGVRHAQAVAEEVPA